MAQSYKRSRRSVGRPARKEPKSIGIWVGQIPDDQRNVILDLLTPTERLDALKRAVEQKTGADWKTILANLPPDEPTEHPG